MRARILIFAVIFAVFSFASLSYSGVPQMINYQGKITTPQGALIDTTVAMVFSIYVDESGMTAPLWSETQDPVKVEKGIFSVLLGSVNPIPDTVFTGEVRYLGVKVGADPEMTPRKSIVSVAYAYKSEYADTSEYAKVAVNDGDWTFRVTDGADTTLVVGGQWGLARYGNTLYGNNDSTHVNLGVASTTGASGQNNEYCTVGGGYRNSATGSGATIGGGSNNTAAGGATVGGGSSNAANGGDCTIGGGFQNYASELASTVAGGNADTANNWWSTVGGGILNTASGIASTVCGGSQNTASGNLSMVSGGEWNSNAGNLSVIPGGLGDTLTSNADYCMVFGSYIYVDSPRRVVFFDGTGHGRLGINRDDHDGGISHPIHVGTGTTNGNGAHLTAGGTWQNSSSREFKENNQALDGKEILQKISNLPVEAWQYKNSEERHIWPYAEDFVRAFNVGTIKGDNTRDNGYLAAADVAGVALAGVKQLIRQNLELRQIIEELGQRIAELEKE